MCVCLQLTVLLQTTKTLHKAPSSLLGATANWRSNIKLNNNHISNFLWFLSGEKGTGRIHISSFHPSILKEEKLSLKVYHLEKQSIYLNLIKKMQK